MRKLFASAMLAALVATPAMAQGPDGGPVEVPMRIDGGRLVVPVMARDGTELAFAVSLANVATIFAESTAARLGEEPALTLGGLPVPTDRVATVPDASLTEGGVALDGMISANMLNRFDILVDAPGGRLVLKSSGRSVAWEGTTLSDPIPLRVFHGAILSLDVELGGKPFGAMLDVGTTRVVVNEGVRSRTGIDAEDVIELGLGAQVFPDLPVEVLDLPVLGRFDPNGNGFAIVGAPLAYDCVLSISWVHQELRTCVP